MVKSPNSLKNEPILTESDIIDKKGENLEESPEFATLNNGKPKLLTTKSTS